ncbi:hypothetical protein [Streptomyces sp. NPDC049555]|uniref:hypothetical protein n=1 Tax=Streptomyces sp. NPDC049555 TaxID=3154930 RepID=UPI003426CCF1
MRAALALAGAGVLWLGVQGGPAVAAGESPGGVHLLLGGAFGSRPGELIDVDVRGLRAGVGLVTVTSPAFARPVRLAPYGDAGGRGFHARPAVATRAAPGTYPLRVHAGGRVVAEDRVRVEAARRPLFTVSARGQVRPGERLGLFFDDLYPGETGDAFTVTSPALRSPVRLRHDARGVDWHNPRMFTAPAVVAPEAADGTYKVTLTGPGGRRIAERPLAVRAARPGDDDWTGRVRGPSFFRPSAHPEDARAAGQRVAAGGTVNVLWRDASPDPGEEESLTATSPAFERPVALRRDDSKAGDGDDPRYYGAARVRRALAPGSYPVTVVSHHGRVRRTGQLLVTSPAAATVTPAAHGGPDRTTLVVAVVAAGTGAAVLAAGTVGLVLRRRRPRVAQGTGDAPS